MESVHSFLQELIFTNYLFFLLLLVLFYVTYRYFKIWPKIIVVRIFNHGGGLFSIDDAETIKYFINGKREREMENNFIRKIKLFGFLDKYEVSIEIISKKDCSIFKSEVKRINRINYFDFHLSEEDSKALQKDGGK